jgi:hypothetical protein
VSILPSHILYDVGNEISIDVPVRPAATQTVACYRDSGAAIFTAQNATLSTINTVNNAAIAINATSLTVSNATGLAASREFWIRSPDEKLLCRSISGTTVTLARPCLFAHTNASTVEGTRITYAVTSTQAGTLFWDGYLDWVIDTGESTARHYHSHCVCTKHPFYRTATTQDLFDEDSLLARHIVDSVDPERLLDKGLREVVKSIAGKTEGRAWSYSGPHQFNDATVLAAFMVFYRPQGSDIAERLYKRYSDAFGSELDRLTGFVRRDTDQDGQAEAHERFSMRSARLHRS